MIGMACPHCGWNLYAPSEMSVKCGRCLNVSNVVHGALSQSPGHLPQLEPIADCKPWDSLHRYAYEHRNDWDATTAERWYLIRWMRTVPKYKPDGAPCGCQTHWAELTKQFPPDFSTPQAFFEWGWARHDDVSRLHSKRPRITLEEAYAIYWPQS